MKSEILKILLIEDNPDDVRLIKEMFSDKSQAVFSIDIADRLSHGLDQARKNHYDAVLLDLGLPDSRGLATFIKLHAAVEHLPIVVISGLDDESVALTAVHEGAQDYLIKGQVDGQVIWRSIRYAIEREGAERQKDLSISIMNLLNKEGDKALLIHEILVLIRDFSGCEAVGIRIKEGDDYPYYEANGFVPAHVELENRLCANDDSGQVVRDSAGSPLLECMCGNVVQGRFDPAMPFFSLQGSFWTNSTTDFMAYTGEAERWTRTRNRCNSEGYESLALIPLKGSNGNIGLLQLNDKHNNRFTSELIRYYEGIAQSVGIVLTRKHAEESLRQKHLMLARTEGIAHIGSWDWDIATDTVTWSAELFSIFQLDPQAGAPSFAEHDMLYHPDDMSLLRQVVEIAVANGVPYELELRAIRGDGEIRICVARGIADIPQGGRPTHLFGTLQDITERKQAEEKILKSHAALKKTLEDSINTMVKIVEMRDPYTSGHQQRVAELATAIAREMQLEDSRIDQIRSAAVIHDIGKMYVPSDILSKPGKLSDIEISLIKTHCQHGYDIVKGMDFPGIIARAILQHHERTDGSGYPNQLKGEDTLVEAKILVVADVIEAMSSHRPYRAALGTEKALQEIVDNRGKLYDPEVVDACLAVFKSGQFEFKTV